MAGPILAVETSAARSSLGDDDVADVLRVFTAGDLIVALQPDRC
jgi:hypothetical protein